MDGYTKILKQGFDTLYTEGAKSGRMMGIVVHPWLIGQPFRIGYFESALDHFMRRQGVWWARASAIVDWYRRDRLDVSTGTLTLNR